MYSKNLLKNLWRRGRNVWEKIIKTETQKAVECQTVVKPKVALTNRQTGWKSETYQTVLRRFLSQKFIDSPARRASKQAFWRGRNDKNILLFAFAGFVMATQSEEDELMCEVQDFIHVKNQSDGLDPPSFSLLVQELSLERFEIGRHIGQGCNAAVYEARWKSSVDIFTETEETDAEEAEIGNEVSDAESDITVLSSTSEDASAPAVFNVHEYDDDWHTIGDSDVESDVSVLDWTEDDVEPWSDTGIDHLEESLASKTLPLPVAYIIEGMESLENTQMLPGGDNESETIMYESLDSDGQTDTGQKFDLAIKMMFNYHVNSNADAILREMERETVPALLSSPGEQVMWDTGHKVRKKKLPPHPNIVTMWGLFVDQVPNLPDNVLNYPAALPQRIHAEGIGKNMTLFLVMKKYPTTLKDYLSVVNLTLRERLVLLTQLLEGVAHMGAHGIAHRDMKCDNILLDIDTDGTPNLVISDFGCCLADNTYGLVLPYTTDLIDRGGNTALMAPEIASAEPGRFAQLDYRKADAWSAGALAYEIFGADNPFYNTGQGRLDSRNYRLDELPHMPDDVPAVVQRVVAALLEREPKKRTTARKAADILHLLLWAPSDWLLPCSEVPRSNIRWWMVTMATEVHLGKKSTLREMKRCFLDHLNINSLLNAFSYCGVNITSK